MFSSRSNVWRKFSPQPTRQALVSGCLSPILLGAYTFIAVSFSGCEQQTSQQPIANSQSSATEDNAPGKSSPVASANSNPTVATDVADSDEPRDDIEATDVTDQSRPDQAREAEVQSGDSTSVAMAEIGTDQTPLASNDLNAGEGSADGNDQPEASDDTVVADSAANDEQADAESSTSDVAGAGDGGGFSLDSMVNAEEERQRQRRLELLGFGEKPKGPPRKIELLVKDREFSTDPNFNALRLTFDDLDLLKILNMEPVPVDAAEYLPEWLTALENKRVVLRGFMYPPDRTEGLKGFIFVRDNQVCCFGPNAKAYDKLTVRLRKGETTSYIVNRPFDVVGTFHIDPWVEDSRDLRTGEFVEMLGMLYHLEDAKVVAP